MRCERGTLRNVHSGEKTAARCLRPRPTQNCFYCRPRTLVIYAKKGNPVYNTSAIQPRDLKKKSSKSSTKHKYVEGTEQPGASGAGAKVVAKEEAPPPPPPVPVVEKEETVLVPVANERMPMLARTNPATIGTIVVAGLGATILILLVVRRLFGVGRKPKEPMITVTQMEATFADREAKMQDEFQKILTEQLEQRDVEYKKQLLAEVGQKEAEFDARFASREREVRKAHEEKFQADLQIKTDALKAKMQTEQDDLKSELQQKFENEKSNIEMEWMKKVEEKEKEQEQSSHATKEAEELVKELKASQEQLKEHETSLETQLKEYESLLETLKSNHATELEGTISSFKTEIRDLKEQIRFQEIEIERKKKEKEEEEERIRASAALQETAQENGHVMEEASEKQAVAVQTKTAPEPEEETPLAPTELLPLHLNGQDDGGKALQAEIRMIAAGTTIPHVDKVLTGGEDAFFTSSAFYGAMGVADGVGGWGGDGVDPAFYAKELMSAASDYLTGTSVEELNAQHAIGHAHSTAKSPGSATICVALVQPDGVLEIANVGDCGVRVVRGTKCIFSTEAMSHEFNMPYQLGNPAILPETDWPEDAEVYSFELQERDIVVMGSDGLFDNMWDDDLARLVNSFAGDLPADEQTAQSISKRLADVAHYNAKQKDIRSPWSVHAAESGMMPLMKRLFPSGGKMDDCAVIVGFANRCN